MANQLKITTVQRFSITVGQVTYFFPDGVKLKKMGWFLKLILGNTPAITFNQTIHYNADLVAAFTPETWIHETVHLFQERRMGKLDYNATYFWQIFISLFRKGPSHIHDDHLMEREARNIAKEIMKRPDVLLVVAGNDFTCSIARLIGIQTGWF